MPGAAGQLKRLYQQIIGGTAPAGAASSSGDVSQMVKYLIDEMAKAVGATNISPSADTSGSLAERIAWLQANGGGAKKVQGSGYLATPTNAFGVTVTGGSPAWTKGSYAQIVASTSAAIYLLGIQARTMSNYAWELDIATGGAGSETIIATIPGMSSTYSCESIIMLPFPIAVPISTRIAARYAENSGSQTNSIKLFYVNQSDLVAL